MKNVAGMTITNQFTTEQRTIHTIAIPHKYCTIFMWDGNCVNRPLLSSKLISDGHTSNILHSLILFPDLHPAFVGSSVIVL